MNAFVGEDSTLVRFLSLAAEKTCEFQLLSQIGSPNWEEFSAARQFAPLLHSDVAKMAARG